MIIATWSGGIDSTAVVGKLLRMGIDVQSVALSIYKDQQPLMWEREIEARNKLLPVMQRIAHKNNCTFTHTVYPAEWIWAFSPDGVEIPNRNRHIIDYLITSHCMPSDCYEIALGEYIGADSWVVQDHVDAMDGDTRSLTSYLLLQWGLKYRLWTMSDFGACRYKCQRVEQLISAIGIEASLLTTNCLHNCSVHCGECYKCIERHVAFSLNNVDDTTPYTIHPSKSDKLIAYKEQMDAN